MTLPLKSYERLCYNISIILAKKSKDHATAEEANPDIPQSHKPQL